MVRSSFSPTRSMNILFIGDIFASAGRSIVADKLHSILTTEYIDLAIANAENSAGGFGITPLIAEELFQAGTGSSHLRQSHLGQTGNLRLPRSRFASPPAGQLRR